MFNRKMLKHKVQTGGITGITSYLTFSSDTAEFTLRCYNINNIGWDGKLYYSKDHIIWYEWNGKSVTSKNRYLYIAGKNNTYITYNNHFVLSGERISCNGNIENLLDWEAVKNGQHPTWDESCFANLFENNTALIQAPILGKNDSNLIMTTGCFEATFRGCTGLQTAPALPSTSLANYCYANMFEDSGIVTPPNLPATILKNCCYSEMFYNAKNMVTIPQISATTLAERCCELMCERCISLTQIPKLKATTFYSDCYFEMFLDCSQMKFSATATADCPNAYRVPYSGTGSTPPSGAISSMFFGSQGYFEENDVEVNRTYYTNMQVV